MRDKRLNQAIWQMPLLPGGALALANVLTVLVETMPAIPQRRKRLRTSVSARAAALIAFLTGAGPTAAAAVEELALWDRGACSPRSPAHR